MLPPLTIDELNTVETSVSTWIDFIDGSMNSEFYKIALARGGNAEEAAALTLLHSYLSTFLHEERRKVEKDVELFYHYAKGFIDELAPYRYHAAGYHANIRASFMGKIKSLLAAQKKNGKIVDRERYTFIRTIVKFCSSLDYIIRIHDRYKAFLFRELPQVNSAI